MTKNKKDPLKIEVMGYDARITESATKSVWNKLVQLKLKVGKPIPFPIHTTKVVPPISPHKHKDAREKYERNTHKRKIFVTLPDNYTPSTLKKLLSLEVPGKVNLRVALPSSEKKKNADD